MRCRELFQVLVGLAAVMLGASGPRVAASAGAQGRRTRDRGSDRSRGRAATPVVSAPESPCIDPQTGQEKNESSHNSFLWTVSERDPPTYLFGTIHVPYTSVWDYIPDNTKRAFYRSDFIVFELDLMDPFTISALNNCQLLPNGQYLADVIPSELYERLRSHLDYVRLSMPGWMTQDQKGRGLYADYLFGAITGNWERKRPVYIMLMINALTESDIQSRGMPVLDLFLAQEAHKMNKRTAAVEEVHEHCVPLNEMDATQVLFALNHTLSMHEDLRHGRTPRPTPSANDLIGHYNCGDLDDVLFNLDSGQMPNMLSLALEPNEVNAAQAIDSYFREELIHKRNERMAQRIVALMEAHPHKTFFFAFGAGHFMGNDSVVRKLQRRGVSIQHTPASRSLQGRSRKRKKQQPDASLPHLVINNNLEYLDPFYDRRRNRQRHEGNRKRGRARKNQEESPQTAKPPEFNDLWIKIDAIDVTSSGSSSYLKQDSVTPHPGSHNTSSSVERPSALLTVLLLLNSLSSFILQRTS